MHHIGERTAVGKYILTYLLQSYLLHVYLLPFALTTLRFKINNENTAKKELMQKMK